MQEENHDFFRKTFLLVVFPRFSTVTQSVCRRDLSCKKFHNCACISLVIRRRYTVIIVRASPCLESEPCPPILRSPPTTRLSPAARSPKTYSCTLSPAAT